MVSEQVNLSALLPKLSGVLSLVTTTVLWGSSFAFIKLSMEEVSPYTYTFVRTAIASVALMPVLLYKAGTRGLDLLSLRRGFITGVAYSTGLCLQAAGTALIDPSMSAFITGLSTIHVHIYFATLLRKYSRMDLAALLLAMLGLYVLTSPTGGLGRGGLLVFVATFMWALQVILIARYKDSSMLEFLFGNFAAGLLFAPLAAYSGIHLTREALVYLAYLALVCSIGATFFQVLGQRRVSALTAALIFLLEPVLATAFSTLMGLEDISVHKVAGGALITLSLYIAVASEFKRNQRERPAGVGRERSKHQRN